MKNLTSTLCRSGRLGHLAMSVGLGAALSVSNGPAVGVAVGIASLVAFGLFGRR
jgi:hypothetical protein